MICLDVRADIMEINLYILFDNIIRQEYKCIKTVFNDMLGCNGGYHGSHSKHLDYGNVCEFCRSCHECYLGLWVDQVYSMFVDGNEQHFWVTGFCRLLKEKKYFNDNN